MDEGGKEERWCFSIAVNSISVRVERVSYDPSREAERSPLQSIIISVLFPSIRVCVVLFSIRAGV